MTLKIEAEKFYRTRDGRKVGPMRVGEWQTKPFDVDGHVDADLNRCLWDRDGSADEGYLLDLIAEWTDEPAALEVGTLRELGVKPGDVVEIVYELRGSRIGETAIINISGHALFKDGYAFWPEYDDKFDRKYRIISRADDDSDGLAYQRQNAPLPKLPYGHARLPSGKVVDLTAIEKPFGLLDAEAQEALQAHGGPYEVYGTDGWLKCDPLYAARFVYRVAPKPSGPVVGEVVAYYGRADAPFLMPDHCKYDTHRLTLPTSDGQLVPGTYTGPDGLEIRVEALE